MLLLALQYSIQPRISKACIDPRVNKQTVAMVEEVAKAGMATLLFAATHCRAPTAEGYAAAAGSCVAGEFRNILKDWTLKSSLLVAGLPAALYAVQGVLSYTSFQNLDSVTFNGLSQTKTLSAAVCCYLVLGKPQSPLQVLALAVLFLSALIFQNIVQIRIGNRTPDGLKSDSPPKTQPGPTKALYPKKYVALGIVPCLAASFLSGLSGSLSQKGLQLTGGQGRDAFFYTMEVSAFSASFLLISILTKRARNTSNDVGAVKTGPFAYWTWKTFLPILIKAFGGVLTALVHKHAGSVVKGFSLMLGLVLAGFTQAVLDGKELSANQIVGTLMVMLSGWMHFTNPPI
jgi:UDP-sugar transporter A1/2/3